MNKSETRAQVEDPTPERDLRISERFERWQAQKLAKKPKTSSDALDPNSRDQTIA